MNRGVQPPRADPVFHLDKSGTNGHIWLRDHLRFERSPDASTKTKFPRRSKRTNKRVASKAARTHNFATKRDEATWSHACYGMMPDGKAILSLTFQRTRPSDFLTICPHYQHVAKEFAVEVVTSVHEQHATGTCLLSRERSELRENVVVDVAGIHTRSGVAETRQRRGAHDGWYAHLPGSWTKNNDRRSVVASAPRTESPYDDDDAEFVKQRRCVPRPCKCHALTLVNGTLKFVGIACMCFPGKVFSTPLPAGWHERACTFRERA